MQTNRIYKDSLFQATNKFSKPKFRCLLRIFFFFFSIPSDGKRYNFRRSDQEKEATVKRGFLRLIRSTTNIYCIRSKKEWIVGQDNDIEIEIKRKKKNAREEKRKSYYYYYYRTPSENGESLERPFEFDNTPSWAFKMFPRKLSAFDVLVS